MPATISKAAMILTTMTEASVRSSITKPMAMADKALRMLLNLVLYPKKIMSASDLCFNLQI
jgi:hypothetical protein